MKTCKDCLEAKELSQFTKTSGLRCHDCYKAVCRERYASNPERQAKVRERGRQFYADNKEAVKARIKKNDIATRYGLTAEAYADLIANGCVICGSHENLHVDHDHNCCPGTTTCGNCVRGALCQPHNMALGLFKDNVDHLAGAMAYLLQHTNLLTGGSIETL